MLTYRNSNFDTSNWKTIRYTDARRSSSFPNAMNKYTGVFTAPLTGNYQFILQAHKVSLFLLLSEKFIFLAGRCVHH